MVLASFRRCSVVSFDGHVLCMSNNLCEHHFGYSGVVRSSQEERGSGQPSILELCQWNFISQGAMATLKGVLTARTCTAVANVHDCVPARMREWTFLTVREGVCGGQFTLTPHN